VIRRDTHNDVLPLEKQTAQHVSLVCDALRLALNRSVIGCTPSLQPLRATRRVPLAEVH
jgi:hypothetical protein